jgi:hypothetical protein
MRIAEPPAYRAVVLTSLTLVVVMRIDEPPAPRGGTDLITLQFAFYAVSPMGGINQTEPVPNGGCLDIDVSVRVECAHAVSHNEKEHALRALCV